MKRLVLIVSLALVAFCCYAQQGEIIYRDFDPDSIMAYWEGSREMPIDLDGEGHPDIRMYWQPFYAGTLYGVMPYIFSYYTDSIQLCIADPDCILTDVEEWHHTFDIDVIPYYNKYGFRFKHGDGYLYGWFEMFTRGSQVSEWEWGFDRVAICAIPDYPLHWGQIETVGVEENYESTTFATLYPNPTIGLVTVTGENLRQAEVFNMLGQQVLSVKGESDELRIDMATLPAGVYFVTVTDGEGRKCVRKVVKE